MRKIIFSLLSALLVCLFFSTTSVAAPEYELRLQCYYSAENLGHITDFANDVEKRSKGRIHITVFPAGEVVSSPNVLKAVSSGVMEMGVSTGSHFTELSIGAIESGLPMSWMSTAEATDIFDKGGLLKLVEEEYAKLGVKYLNVLWNAEYTIISKEPIRSLDDLRKMTIRAIGGSAMMFEALGVKTMPLAPEDIRTALAKDQIQAALYGAPFEYVVDKYYEVAPYILTTPVLNPITDGVLINQKIWDKMDTECRNALLDAAQTMRTAYYDYGMGKDKEALSTVFKDKQTTLSDADIAALTKAAVDIWNKESERNGVTAKAIEIIKEHAKRVGRIQ